MASKDDLGVSMERFKVYVNSEGFFYAIPRMLCQEVRVMPCAHQELEKSKGEIE